MPLHTGAPDGSILDVGSPQWAELVTQVAETHPDSIAANLVKWASVDDYLKPFIDDLNRHFVIQVFTVTRQPGRTEGWRWRKWGPYIGKLEAVEVLPETSAVAAR